MQADIREILQFNLENAGFVTDCAASAEEALEMVSSDHALILLDVMMPEMDGIAFLKIMTEKGYLGAFPVLVVTSEQSVNQVAECFEYGAADYIRKPVNTDFVKQMMKW